MANMANTLIAIPRTRVSAHGNGYTIVYEVHVDDRILTKEFDEFSFFAKELVHAVPGEKVPIFPEGILSAVGNLFSSQSSIVEKRRVQLEKWMQDLVKVDAIRLSIHWRIFIEQIDAHGLVFVVTGSSSGIGEELCKILVKANARVIMACRDVSKAQKVADKLLELRKDAKVTAMKCDVSSMTSVRKFAEEFIKLDLPLHALVCNAGVVTPAERQPKITEDGFDVLQANGKPGTPSRLINTSSSANLFVKKQLPIEDEYYRQFGNSPGFMGRYMESKLALVMMSREITKRYFISEKPITSVSLHPGYVNTPILQWLPRFVRPVVAKVLITPSQGALSLSVACFSERYDHVCGPYLNEWGMEAEPSRYAFDETTTKGLWELSEKHVDLK